MRQSRLMSLVEAVTNVVVGLVVAVATQLVVFPILGLQASLGQNLTLALVFTGVSIVRSYALRRMLEAFGVWRPCWPKRQPRVVGFRHAPSCRPGERQDASKLPL
jgi:hypothetical protein